MSNEMRDVSKDEFAAFLKAYPRKLERDVYAACEPPMVTYNDFERAPYWPDSIVASTSTEGTFFRIIADINSPVPDDGKRDTDTPLLDRHGIALSEGDRIRVHWGWSATGEIWREHTATIRDKGTKYEAWSPHDCANKLRSMTFEVVKLKEGTDE